MTPNFSSDAFIQFLNNDKNFDGADHSLLHNMKGTANRLMLNVIEGEFSDIRNANPEELIQRHINIAGVSMSHNSQLTYRSRFNRAVNMFIKHQNDELGLPTQDTDLAGKPTMKAKVGAMKQRASASIEKKRNEYISVNEANNSDSSREKVAGKTFSIPVLIRPSEGIIVDLINVPMDLTPEEADRISSILKLYAQKA